MEKVLTIFMTKNLAHSALILTKKFKKRNYKIHIQLITEKYYTSFIIDLKLNIT